MFTDDGNVIPADFILDTDPIQDVSSLENDDLPTVLVTTLVRNKEHSLPYFLGCLENLDYPTDKITVFIRSDHNADKSNGL